MIDLSVIVPCQRDAESCQEIVILDDHSTDATYEDAAKLLELDE
jgi:glycosyltransferase involved in cell wall biosynthesis